MPAIHETAYSRLKSHITPQELQEIYTPGLGEIRFYDKVIQGRRTKVQFLVLLKTFQRLGWFPTLQEVPPAIIQHISNVVQRAVTEDQIKQYDRSRSRKRHMSAIRDFCKIRPYGPSARRLMSRAAIE